MSVDKESIVPGLVAVAVIGTYCFLTGLMIFRTIPADNMQLFSAAMTALVGMATGIIGYFFGNAHGQAKEAAKTREMMAAAMPAQQPSVAEVTAEAAKKS